MAEPASHLRVVVADDEPIARRGLERLLASEDDIEIVAACKNGTQTLDAIRAHRPDLAFLDVAMPGMTGIDVVRALSSNERPAIVFVTAFDRFAIDAFDLHAVDYLLKPFDADRFHTALMRARERLSAKNKSLPAARIDALLEALEQRPRTPERIVVKQGDRMLFVPLAEIDWCEAADNYVKLCVGGRRHMIRDTMREMEKQLGPGFARIHRSVIVNLDRVRELRPLFHGDYQVLLNDGTKLTLSRGYREAVLARIWRSRERSGTISGVPNSSD